MKPAWIAIAVLAGAASNPAWPHGDKADNAKGRKAPISTEEKPFGREGDPKKATRTI